MRIEADIKLDFKDVLIRPKRSTLSSRSQVELERTYTFKHTGKKWTGIPIIASNMDATGTFDICKVLTKRKCLTVMSKHYEVQDWVEFARDYPECLKYAAISTGSKNEDIAKVERILAAVPELDMICIDVANGYHEKFVLAVATLRKKFPDSIIFAGNVVTNDMTEELILKGADVVKVGIGAGSVCTTRKMTGVGYPQLSAVIETADAAHGLGGLVVSDGGCTNPGDVCKAFGAGADFVMLGGMLAGHDESGGDVVQLANGKQVKVFYGMSSHTAMKKHAEGVAEYRASEGKTVTVSYRGPIDNTVLDLCGGIRSTCTYVGASCLKELSKRTTFVRVSQQLNSVFDACEIETQPSDIRSNVS